LRDGDRLPREEFLRRWSAMPDLKHAELIDGVVHMPSPVLHTHGRFHSLVHWWLFQYAFAMPSCAAGLEETWLMGADAAPQPDLTLRILPEHGGQSRIVDDYLTGAPELAVEITHSSSARDLGAKSDLYRRSGVREYLVILTQGPDVLWREVTGNRYRRLAPTSAGILKSRVFPGLWLDLPALGQNDQTRLLETLRNGIRHHCGVKSSTVTTP
jgi:Uma2 family endonuclease